VCEGRLSEAWVDLGRLRDAVETTLDRVDQRHGPLSRRIDRALGSER
jgi:hypothetical protein